MLRTLLWATLIAGSGVSMLAGCGQTVFPAALGPTLEDVNRIRNSETLEPHEKRRELEELLGVEDPNDRDDPGVLVINGLLIAEGVANQFGGTLTTAFQKVEGERLTKLTPDEVQIYADATDITEYGDVEGRAIAEFFHENEVDSLSELAAFLDNPETVVPAGIDEDDLRAVFSEEALGVVFSQLP